jgi:uncharacterized membrane protein
MKVKIGTKGKHMEIPDGWFQVTEGECEEYDMFANVQTFKWNHVESDDVKMPANTFDCLIRKNK